MSASIILDTQAPEIKVSSPIEFKYDADVILTGTVNKPAQIILSWLNERGLINSNNGVWAVNLGKINPGSYLVTLKAEDAIGNSKVIYANITVKEKPQKQSDTSIIEKIKDATSPILNILTPKTPKPKDIVKVPAKAPVVFSNKWDLLPEKAVQSFVFSPLPADIKSLAEKFPKLADTLNNVGVSKMTNITALNNINLTMPGLSEVVNPPATEVLPGKFMSLPGLPIVKFSLAEKNKIPTNVIFARTANGLVDLNTILSVDNHGSVQQKINTLIGTQIELLVKTDEPAKSVKVYFVFKSRNSQAAIINDTKNFTAALIDSVFAKTASGLPEQKLLLSEVDLKDTGDNVYTATAHTPTVSGEYEIITIIQYKDIKLANKEISLINVVDPEGYVYERSGNKETRINGATVSLYWLNPNTKQYEIWPADNYQQGNPQVTDVAGTYSFLVPNGYYYLKVAAPGYDNYNSRSFQVSDGDGIHMNIELRTKYWWAAFTDWKTALLIVVVILLLYNFYKDRKGKYFIVKPEGRPLQQAGV